jgi:hypothetical protein
MPIEESAKAAAVMSRMCQTPRSRALSTAWMVVGPSGDDLIRCTPSPLGAQSSPGPSEPPSSPLWGTVVVVVVVVVGGVVVEVGVVVVGSTSTVVGCTVNCTGASTAGDWPVGRATWVGATLGGGALGGAHALPGAMTGSTATARALGAAEGEEIATVIDAPMKAIDARPSP